MCLYAECNQTDVWQLSELVYIIPRFQHLKGVRLNVAYNEVREWGKTASLWRQDPGAGAFPPQESFYIDGQLVGDRKERLARVSKTPFPEIETPRRMGLSLYEPGDMDSPDNASDAIKFPALSSSSPQSVKTVNEQAVSSCSIPPTVNGTASGPHEDAMQVDIAALPNTTASGLDDVQDEAIPAVQAARTNGIGQEI